MCRDTTLKRIRAETGWDGMGWNGGGGDGTHYTSIRNGNLPTTATVLPFYQSTRLIHLGERTSETTYERVPLKTSHVRTCVRACVCVAWRGGARINSSLRFTSD